MLKSCLIALLLVFGAWTYADAQCVAGPPNPTNPKTMCWTAPTTNKDGTPLGDLASYTLKVRTTSTIIGVVQKSIGQASPVMSPAPNTFVTHGSVAAPFYKELTGLPDGPYFGYVTATDTFGNESDEQPNGVPFVLNQVSPGAVTGVTFGQ